MSAQAAIFSEWGKPVEAKAIYAEFVARSSSGFIQPSQLAIAASAAGESECAVAHGEQAFAIRDPFLFVARHWPDLARLRQDPRFREILARMGFH